MPCIEHGGRFPGRTYRHHPSHARGNLPFEQFSQPLVMDFIAPVNRSNQGCVNAFKRLKTSVPLIVRYHGWLAVPGCIIRKVALGA